MIAAVLRELMDAGLEGAALMAAVERIEAAEQLQMQLSADIPRNSADISADKRRAADRERKRLVRRIPQNSADIPQNSNVAPIDSLKDKKDRGRGTRIPPDWTPTPADVVYAKSRGMSDPRIALEGEKFKNHWMAQAGRSATKSDWHATWCNWVIRSLEFKPPDAKPADRIDIGGFYASSESPQLEAWDQHGLRTKGKRYPRDRNGGWRFPTEWPPDETEARAQ